MLKLTTARYFTPSGQSTHQTGILPDEIVAADETKPISTKPPNPTEDQQLARALAMLVRR